MEAGWVSDGGGEGMQKGLITGKIQHTIERINPEMATVLLLPVMIPVFSSTCACMRHRRRGERERGAMQRGKPEHANSRRLC